MKTRAGRALRLIACIIAIGGLVGASVRMLFTLAASMGTSDSAVLTAKDWAWKIAYGSDMALQDAVLAGCGIVVAAVISVIAVRLRRPGWLWFGTAAGAVCVLTLLGTATVWGSFMGRVDTAMARMRDTTHAQNQRTAVEPADLPSLDVAQSGMRHMIELTLDAVAAPRGADGAAFTTDRVQIFQNACADEKGVTLTGDIVLLASPGDPTMAADILVAWDDAGYLADWSGQEDIRYSQRLPVSSLALHDTTTIDGLVHMHLVSQWSAPR